MTTKIEWADYQPHTRRPIVTSIGYILVWCPEHPNANLGKAPIKGRDTLDGFHATGGARMTFTEARKALQNGAKIRHEGMPDGNAFMLYQRGFSTDMVICVDANENLSADDVDFCDILASAFYDSDTWEVLQ